MTASPPRRIPSEYDMEISRIAKKFNITFNAAMKIWIHKMKEKRWQDL